jgi:hypothetical protein
VWFAQLPSPRSPTGWREQEITDLFDVRTGSLYPLGVGDQPRWSGTGTYIAYWGPNADEPGGHDSRVVARLAPTIPDVQGRGRPALHEEHHPQWRDGASVTSRRSSGNMSPAIPDDVYFSAD